MTDPYFEIVAGVFDNKRSILDNPNISLTDPAVWEEVFGTAYTTDAGIQVNSKAALTYAPVWQAVSLISGGVARLPLNVYRRRPDIGEDAREIARTHPLSAMLTVSPNEEEDAFKFWRRFMVHCLLWNNGYIYINRQASQVAGQLIVQAGYPTGLVHLLPDRTHPERIGGLLYYVTEADGKLWAMSAQDVIHVEGLSVEGMAECNLVLQARNAIAKALAREKFEAKFFRSGGRVGGILELPAGMPKLARDTVEEGFRRTYEGSDNPFKTVILRDSAKFHAAQTSPRDTQLVEAGEADVRQVARWFNLPPSKLGLSDSVSYNSKEEDGATYLDDCLTPWLLGTAGQVNHKMLNDDVQREYFVEHDTHQLLRMRMSERYAAYQVGIASRFLSPNEARARENLMPYEGGDEFENPNTSSGSEPKEPPEPPEPTDEEAKSARRRVLFNMTGRARMKAMKPGAFTAWLDGGFAPHREEWKRLMPRAAEPEFFQAFRRELADAAETVTAEQLPAVVDAIATNFERAI